MAAIHRAVEEEPAAFMAEQAVHVPPALLLLLLHLPHILHPGSHPGSLRFLHRFSERHRPRRPRLAADPALRGQVLRQAPLLRLRVEWK